MTELTDIQIKTLDWGLTCLIEQTEENAHGYQPDQAVEEICGLASLVELLPAGDKRTQLTNICEEIRREHQVRLDVTLAQEEAEQTPVQKLRAAIEGLLETAALSEVDEEDQSLVDNARAVLEQTA